MEARLKEIENRLHELEQRVDSIKLLHRTPTDKEWEEMITPKTECIMNKLSNELHVKKQNSWRNAIGSFTKKKPETK